MAVCTDLDRKMQSMDEDIMVNPQYVKKTCGAPDDDVPSAPSQGSKITTYSM
jgi:COP9 signalosome complex subunit 3